MAAIGPKPPKIENNILKGEEVFYRSGFSSLGEFVLHTLKKDPDFIGQVDAMTDEKYTYDKMRERSVRCAVWMKSQGIVRGDIIAICTHNQLDSTMPCFASLYLGASFNPLDSMMNTGDILHLINLLKPKMAFASEELFATITEAVRAAGLDVKIVVFGQATGAEEFERIISEPSDKEVANFRCVDIEDPEETAFIICSSGTTGLPKGVALSNRSILNQLQYSTSFKMEGNNCLCFSPLYWITGTVLTFLHLRANVMKIVAPAFAEDIACSIAEKYEVNWLILGASMVNRLLKSGILTKSKYDLRSISRVYYGGGPLSVASHQELAELLPDALVFAAYGITELGGIASMQCETSKLGSCGNIVPNTQIKVIDTHTGQALGADQQGEVLLKNSSLMTCYYNNPKDTAETIDEEGWLHTGDLGYYDADGEIFIIDRLKELIKYRGYQISPFEIESVLLSDPKVKEVAVVGRPHFEDDEHPIAFVVKVDGEEVTETMLMELVASKLSDFKHLRGGVRFISALPKAPSYKVRRKELRELAKNIMVK